jgi:hypothetical protein
MAGGGGEVAGGGGEAAGGGGLAACCKVESFICDLKCGTIRISFRFALIARVDKLFTRQLTSVLEAPTGGGGDLAGGGGEMAGGGGELAGGGGEMAGGGGELAGGGLGGGSGGLGGGGLGCIVLNWVKSV